MAAHRTHVSVGDGTLCGSAFVTAAVNSTDCARCNRLVDELLDLLLDAARGQTVEGRARKLAARCGLRVDSEE